MNRVRSLSLGRVSTWTASWYLRLGICLVLLLTSLAIVRHGDAQGGLRVDEGKTVILLQNEPAQLQRPVTNSTNQTLVTNLQLELLDPWNQVLMNLKQEETIAPGTRTLQLVLPFQVSRLKPETLRVLPWLRLHYQITD